MTLLDLYRPIRKNSYPLISVGIIAALGYFVFKPFSVPGLILMISVMALLVFIWFWLKPGQFDIDTQEVFDAVGNGRPTFLNAYSNT